MTDYAQEVYADLEEAAQLADQAEELERLRADVARLSALLAAATVAPAPRPKVARKSPAASRRGRKLRRMVDDPVAGFVAADYYASDWHAPTAPAPLDPWLLGAPIPVGADAMAAAGWLPVSVGLQGGRLEHDRPQWPGDGEQTVRVSGWLEPPEYHRAVCEPHAAAQAAVRAERKAERDAAWTAEHGARAVAA